MKRRCNFNMYSSQRIIVVACVVQSTASRDVRCSFSILPECQLRLIMCSGASPLRSVSSLLKRRNWQISQMRTNVRIERKKVKLQRST